MHTCVIDTAKKINPLHHPQKLLPAPVLNSQPAHSQENRELLSIIIDEFAYSRTHMNGITQYVLSVSGMIHSA